MNVLEFLKIDNPQDYKLHMARDNGKVQPLDVFVRDRQEWHGWNSWYNGKDDFNRNYILSFIQMYPEGKDIWLFGGIYEVIGRTKKPKTHAYKVKLSDEGKEYIGRLKTQIEMSRPKSVRLENFADKLGIYEVLSKPYSVNPFPGTHNISEDFSYLQSVYKHSPQDWKTGLQNKGIYVITDKETGKLYIGSAYGESGIWSRWEQYINNGHGGNKDLKSLIDEKEFKYAEQSFKLTIIEYFSHNTHDDYITDRENFWKKALLTKEHGYNSN